MITDRERQLFVLGANRAASLFAANLGIDARTANNFVRIAMEDAVLYPESKIMEQLAVFANSEKGGGDAPK